MIIIYGKGLDGVFGCVARLVAVFDFPVEHAWALLSVVVAFQMTLLCKDEMSLCSVSTSSSFIFAFSESLSKCREFSGSIMQKSVNCYLSGRCKSMTGT